MGRSSFGCPMECYPPVPEALIMVDRLERDEALAEFRLHLGRVLSVKYSHRKRQRGKNE
jgi:hypothetical protein